MISRRSLSRSAAGTSDAVGRKHAELLEFLATRGQVAFDPEEIKRARRLLKAARAELLGPLPTSTDAAIIDGWVRRVTLKCSDAAALWPELAADPPALARLEEIELVFDEGLAAWIEVASRHRLRVTRFHLDAQYCDRSTGELLDTRENSARVVAAANALTEATELVLELFVDASSSLAGLELPQLTALAVLAMAAESAEQGDELLATLWTARCPLLRRVGWESHAPVDPSLVLAAPPQISELGAWCPNHDAILAALAAERPELTALGVSDDDDHDSLRALGEGRRLFGPRCIYVDGFNAGFTLLHELERPADGAAQFAALRGRNCSDADVHFQYGNAVEDDALRVNAYCEALLVDPDHSTAHNNLGDALLRLERWRPALYHLRRYLAIKPEFTAGWRDVITAHRALGEEEEARAAEANLHSSIRE